MAPNEIALNILIAGRTLIFLMAVITLQPFAKFSVAQTGSGAVPAVAVLVSLLVCLIPTTIGGLLSPIGIAGMDPGKQHNALAMSGKAPAPPPARKSRFLAPHPPPPPGPPPTLEA